MDRRRGCDACRSPGVHCASLCSCTVMWVNSTHTRRSHGPRDGWCRGPQRCARRIPYVRTAVAHFLVTTSRECQEWRRTSSLALARTRPCVRGSLSRGAVYCADNRPCIALAATCHNRSRSHALRRAQPRRQVQRLEAAHLLGDRHLHRQPLHRRRAVEAVHAVPGRQRSNEWVGWDAGLYSAYSRRVRALEHVLRVLGHRDRPAVGQDEHLSK